MGEQETNLVCRVCMDIEKSEDYKHLDDIYEDSDVIIRDMLHLCVPEIDSYVSLQPIICLECLKFLAENYNFKNKCLESESKIRNYLEKYKLFEYNQVNLNSVLRDSPPPSSPEAPTNTYLNKIVIAKTDKNGFVILNGANNTQTNEFPNQTPTNSFQPNITPVDVNDFQRNLNLNQNHHIHPTNPNLLNGNYLPPCDTMNDINTRNMHMNPLNPIIPNRYNMQHRHIMHNYRPPPSMPMHPTNHLTNGFHMSGGQVLSHMRPPIMPFNHQNPAIRNGFNIQDGQTTRHINPEHMPENPQNPIVLNGMMPPGQSNFKTFPRVQNALPNQVPNSKPPSLLMPCKFCPFATTTPKLFYEHKCPNREIFKCQNCSFQSHDKVRFRVHMNSYHKQNTQWQYCPECEFSTSDGECMRRHRMEAHNSELLKHLKCPKCPYIAHNDFHFKRHMVKHEDSSILKCENCSYETRDKSNFKKHQFIHGNSKPVKCNFCSYECISPYQMRRHLKKFHNKSSPSSDMYTEVKEIKKEDGDWIGHATN